MAEPTPEPTPADEIRAALDRLRTNPRFGGIPWVSLAPLDLIAALAALLESWDGLDIREGGPHSADWAYALAVARAINASGEGT